MFKLSYLKSFLTDVLSLNDFDEETSITVCYTYYF